MNKTEVAKLLTMASAIDNRIVGTETVEAWYIVIGDLEFDDASSAMFAHFRETDEYLTPRKIITGVEAIQRRRAGEERRLKVEYFTTLRELAIKVETEKVESGAADADPDRLSALSRGEWDPEWDYSLAREELLKSEQFRSLRLESNHD